MENTSLTIAAQFPEEKYNLLVPMKTVTEIAAIHKPVMNTVQISTDLKDGEIYIQEKAKPATREYPAQPPKYALTKKGLNKLMRAAGIKILGTRPVVPSTCQKCSEVNRNIGRPVNCGACGNKDVKFEARISVPQLTGENIEVVAHKEIVVDDVVDGMTEKQRKEFLKFRTEMCETKAINRALRAAMHIKGTYLIEELKKPFVVAYLVPNLDNEAVRDEAIRHFFSSAGEIYGEHNADQRRVVYVEDEDGFDFHANGSDHQPDSFVDADYEEPAPAPVRDPAPARQKTAQQSDESMCCTACGKAVTRGVKDWSLKQYGRILCMDCQKGAQQG